MSHNASIWDGRASLCRAVTGFRGQRSEVRGQIELRLDPDKSGPCLFWFVVLALALAGGARAADGGAPGHYSGKAVDEHGQPVAGATVECYVDSSPESFYTAQDFALKERGSTDSKGGFTVPIGGGVTTVVVRKEGLAPG